jgi:hypothetical protein
MAVLSMFYGIIVSMYYYDNTQHKNHISILNIKRKESVFSIPDGEMIEGKMQSTRKKLVQAWIIIHQDELMADWELAISGEQVFKNRTFKIDESTNNICKTTTKLHIFY